MTKYIEVTEDEHPNRFKLLKSMELGVKYTLQELVRRSSLNYYTVKNSVSWLRECYSFILRGKLHHLAKHQITKNQFSYILREGKFEEDDYYFQKSKNPG